MKSKTTRRNITLMEVMIVMFIIALVSGVLGYNYYNSMESARANTTKMGANRIQEILVMEVHSDEAFDTLEQDWQSVVARSPLSTNKKSFYQDGWGNDFKVKVEEDRNGNKTIEVISERLEQYEKGRGKTANH